MKKMFLLFLAVPLWTSCSEDNNGIDCELFDPAYPSLYLELVDAEDTNLFENGTLDPEDIRVEGDFPNAGFSFNPPREFAVPEADIRKLDNTIQLLIPDESNFHYTIYLSETNSIQVSFSAELTQIPCNLSYYLPLEGTFNRSNFELTEVPPLQFLGVIELQ
ncbi:MULTISPECIES: hypothetical protein [unclassified Croceitalea]|uniref:hypothetical protein n=1 Tax=unclassified Croceitalea TaxID=2632280 RepID=UPI0030DAD90A